MSGVQNNILVTGGCGYIGGHVMKALKEAGYNPVAFDINVTHGEYVAPFGTVVEGDILDTAALEQAMRAHDIDGVVHMAAFISVPESEQFPEKYHKNNVEGTASVLRAMKTCGVQQLVFSSTAAVYGFPDNPKIHEDAPTQPMSVYGKTKLLCEEMIADSGLDAMVFRYFNAAGCDPQGDVGNMQENPGNLLPIVLEAAAGKREGVDIFGHDYDTPDGTALRDYIHVSDLADAHVRAVSYLRAHKGSHILNLGSGANYSVRDIVDLAKDVTNTEFEVRNAPRRAGDPAAILACSDKAEAVLGWKAQYNMREMIQTAWNWVIKVK